MHLDLSYNFFSLQECVAISCELAKNHTLLGLHVEGNSHFVTDARGFMVRTVPVTRIARKRIHGVKPSLHRGNILVAREGLQQQDDASAQVSPASAVQESCWICEGWV